MAPPLLTVTDRDGALEPVELGAGDPGTGNLEAVTTLDASVGTGLAGADQGAASDEDFPLATVLVVLVLIVVGVAAGVLGFRSTRRKKDTLDEHAEHTEHTEHTEHEDQRTS